MAQKTIYRLHTKILGLMLFCCISPIQAQLQTIPQTEWEQSFEKAATYVDNNKNECAKFVNRLFALRFGHTIWGNAWDIPLQSENQPFLALKWVADTAKISPQTNWVQSTDERIALFKELYSAIEHSKTGFGLAGFAYRFSFEYKNIRANDLPQTHITFVSPRTKFALTNTANQSQTVQELLETQLGTIHAFEEDFINERLNAYKNMVETPTYLSDLVPPNQSVWYYDFPMEEQFKVVRSDNILFAFIRKHRNNKVSALLRPVSWTDILPAAWK